MTGFPVPTQAQQHAQDTDFFRLFSQKNCILRKNMKLFILSVVAITMATGKVAAFSVGGTFLTAAEKAALEETAAAVATPGKGITGREDIPVVLSFMWEYFFSPLAETNK